MLEALVALAFGLLIGSFLNVCIYRLPRDLSVVSPRSHCIACDHTIAWYDNLPLASYLLLGGKCRYCQARISARYPIVEVLTGGCFFLYVLRLGPTLPALKYCILAALLIGLLFSDLEERILPDELTLGGAAIGIILSYFVKVQDFAAHLLFLMVGNPLDERSPWLSVAESVLGAFFPAFILWLGGYIYEKVRKREGMGFGDVKMMMMIGAFLGTRGTILTMVIASVLGSVVGFVYIRITHKEVSTYELPFGSFLAFGALLVTLIEPAVFDWYGAIGR